MQVIADTNSSVRLSDFECSPVHLPLRPFVCTSNILYWPTAALQHCGSTRSSLYSKRRSALTCDSLICWGLYGDESLILGFWFMALCSHVKWFLMFRRNLVSPCSGYKHCHRWSLVYDQITDKLGGQVGKFGWINYKFNRTRAKWMLAHWVGVQVPQWEVRTSRP